MLWPFFQREVPGELFQATPITIVHMKLYGFCSDSCGCSFEFVIVHCQLLWYTKLQRNLSLLEERQGKMKRCTFSFLTFHPYLSAVSLDNLKGDVEADAQPGIGSFLRISDLVEPLKNLLLMLFGNPNPKILNAHKGIILIFCDTHEHCACLGRILDRVIQEVNQYLPNAVPVPKRLSLGLAFKQQMMRLCRSLYVFHDFLHQSIQIKVFFSIDELARLHFGNIEQIIDEFG